MEGQTRPTNKLKFVESKKKIRVEGQISQPHTKLITTANKHNLTLIGGEDNSVKCVETNQLFDFTSNQPQVINQTLTTLVSLTFRPTLLSVARYGYSSVLFISGTSNFPKCPTIEVYDIDSRTTIGKLSLNDLGDADIIDYAWHPNYFESLVALCTNRGHLLVLAINKQDKGIGIVYKNEQYGALTCCWSMKGKNLAVGTQRGQVFRLEPVVGNNSFSFKEVVGSNFTFENPKITSDHQVVRLRWINQKHLIATHARLNNPNGPETVYSLFAVKPGTPYLYWTNVSFEGQTKQNYVVHLANLSNSVICASSATGEAAVIGVIGVKEATSNDLNDWSALIVEEEGARIELPLDSNNCETHPCGVTMTTWPQDGRPILIFYTNDGLICPYAIMHSDNILKLPEHINQPEQKFVFDVPKLAPQSAISSFGGKASFYQAPVFGGTPSFFKSSPLAQPAAQPATSTPFQGPFTSGNNFQTSAQSTSSASLEGGYKSSSLTQQTTQPTTSATFQSPFSFQANTQPANPFQAVSSQQGQTSLLSQSVFQTPSLFQSLSTAAQPSQSTPAKSNETSQLSQNTFQTSSLFQSLAATTATPVAPTALAAVSSLATSETPATPETPVTPAAIIPVTSVEQTKQKETPQAPQNSFQTSSLFQTSSAAPATLTTPATLPFASITTITSEPKKETSLFQQNTFQTLSSSQSLTAPVVKPALKTPQNQPFDLSAQTKLANVTPNPPSLFTPDMRDIITDKIKQANEKLEFNEAYITLFEELNHLRDRFDDTLDLHRAHQEALNAVKEDIDGLDLEVLETFYLLEYVKSRISCDIKKKTIDPVTLKKVTNIKLKLKQIEGKLEELNDHVDVSWEDFVRRRSNKERRVMSLDVIYKALATNQKVINVLKKKVEIVPDNTASNTSFNAADVTQSSIKPREDHSRFEEFLASRSVVPVRKPIHLKQ